VARILYIHWHPREAADRAKRLREGGHLVAVGTTGDRLRGAAKWGPEILVISLDRLPAHGRAVAAWWWESKSRRQFPILFEGGQDEAKVLATREKTDLTDRGIREALLKKGLVDSKVCAVDDVWSGLRFTRRRR
jgi:hypothetical protein